MTVSNSPSLSLFEDFVVGAPQTQGIKYAGAKTKLLPQILQLAHQTGANCIFDGFSGTTRVAQAFAQSGYRVVCNDISAWSKVFGMCYLENNYPRKHYHDLLQHLNVLPGQDGWFTEHYGGKLNDGVSKQADALKKPWQIHNTRRLDAIREEIEQMNLVPCEKAVALTSLMLALDEVDNTLGHFASYLREWSPRSYKHMELKVPCLLPNHGQHKVCQGDVFDCLLSVNADLAYYDPPYGSNNDKMPPSRVRYGAYYHLWTSVCLFDKPEVFGKAKRRTDTSDRIAPSVFEAFKRSDTGKFIAVEAIERLLKNTNAPYIILSYSSGGRATAQELYEVIASVGTVRDFVRADHKRHVMGGMRWTKEWVREAEEANQEYLFLIEKR